MTDYPIPDELRDQFVRLAAEAWEYTHQDHARWHLLRMARNGFNVELRLPEFAVHDECCAQTITLHVIDMRTSPAVECLSCDWAMIGATDAEATAGADAHNAALEAEQRANRVPCPGVGYYHWTVSE